MNAGVVITGRAEAGLMVCKPPPGMANVIDSGSGMLSPVRYTFASRSVWAIACRSEPGPLSLVFVTTGLVMAAAWENSDVSVGVPPGAVRRVAVAVMNRPGKV